MRYSRWIASEINLSVWIQTCECWCEVGRPLRPDEYLFFAKKKMTKHYVFTIRKDGWNHLSVKVLHLIENSQLSYRPNHRLWECIGWSIAKKSHGEVDFRDGCVAKTVCVSVNIATRSWKEHFADGQWWSPCPDLSTDQYTIVDKFMSEFRKRRSWYNIDFRSHVSLPCQWIGGFPLNHSSPSWKLASRRHARNSHRDKEWETNLTYWWEKVCVKLSYLRKSQKPGEKEGYRSETTIKNDHSNGWWTTRWINKHSSWRNDNYRNF
jgi:hypothetical protein